MKTPVKVLFASATQDRVQAGIEHVQQLFPELPLVVVSEFQPGSERWIPFHPSRSFRDNLSHCRWHLRDRQIRLCAVMLQPHKPYWRMRWMAFVMAPANFLIINEYFGHFLLRPRSIGTMIRHVRWRLRSFLAFELRPGGHVYTYLWRLGHPHAFVRPLNALAARTAGLVATVLKALLPASAPIVVPSGPRPNGVSVVIPSRNGKDLLVELLPELVRQVEGTGGEIIVVDNGSDDRSSDFLALSHPGVVLVQHAEPLSFARAVNAGIRKSRYSHVCLLNNDMAIREGFLDALLAAFEKVPGLFCATAQIFFPDGARREETGKAVMPFASERKPADFPIHCETPLAGEDLSYVLYGSGGCSLFAADKLLALGGLDEVYEPAYVEDLDLGFRGWRQGWPSVFAAAAQVVHQHRTTTSRYYSAEFLDRMLETNYLRFVARAIADPGVFLRLWRQAIVRLNLLSAHMEPEPGPVAALAQAWRIPIAPRKLPRAALSDSHILALGSGAVSVTPGRASRQRPVVLVVSSYLPFPLSHGGAVRMYNLMRRAAADFDQVLVSFTDLPAEVPVELKEICCEVVQVKRPGTHRLPRSDRPDVVEEFDSPAFHAALRQTVAKWRPAIAQIEFTQMGLYSADCVPARTILVEHDVTFDLCRQLLAQGDDWELRRQLARWVAFETDAWRRVDRVVTMSAKDRALVAGEGQPIARTVCLPNGVDLERFRPDGGAPDPRRILFIGSFAHLPNVLAVDFFLREVWPRLEAHHPELHIIAGARSGYYLERYQERARIDLAQPGIEWEDFVSDVRPAYQRAAIVVAPLLASAGTNIKIMEAMAMGKAIVSTPAGINGLDLDAGSDVLVANNAAEMAERIGELIACPERRVRLEHQARETVERKYDWDAIAREQRKLYEELIAAASRLRKRLVTAWKKTSPQGG